MFECINGREIPGEGEFKKLWGMTFLGGFLGFPGRIWMKIGGNQAEAFPDLPIQPRNLDFDRKTGKVAKDISTKLADVF